MTGSFAVISLMVAQVVEREVGSTVAPSPTPGNASDSTDSSSGLFSPTEQAKIEIAVSLSLLVGIIQVMYFTRFVLDHLNPTSPHLTAYLAPPLHNAPLFFMSRCTHRCALILESFLGVQEVENNCACDPK